MRAAVIVTAAGASRRFGGSMKKEYLRLNGAAVLYNTLSAFADPALFTDLLVTIPAGDEAKAREALEGFERLDEVIFTPGGETRQASVFAGLKALEQRAPEIVLIHDGARPWCTADLARAVAERSLEAGAAAPAIPSIDAMKILSRDGFILDHLSREAAFRIQTPQGFIYEDIVNAHLQAARDGGNYIDDTEIYGRYIGAVATVPGDEANRKITYQEDLLL